MRDLLDLFQQTEGEARLAELHELAQPILRELADTLGYQRAFVALVDPERRCLQGAVGINVPDELVEALRARVDEPGPLVQAFLLGKPTRVDDALRDPRVPESLRPYYSALGMQAFAAIPLPPARGVLVVSNAQPISEAQVNELLPFAAKLVAAVAERGAAERQRESGEQHAIEKEWLWWMLNTVRDPIVLSDERNEIFLMNIQAERLLRTTPDDSPGKRRAIEINNFLLSAALSSFALDQGASFGRELTLVDPIEGAELLFEVICSPATNLRTGERGLVTVLKDVTDLRRADEELSRSLAELERTGEEARRERDRLNLILESVADPIIVTDPASKIILMNPPAERLLQPKAGTEPGARATIYLANDAKVTSFLSQLRLEATPVRHGEIQLVDPETEEPLTFSVTATEVRGQLGEILAVVSVLHDLTPVRELERRRVEQQLFESEKLAAVGRLAAAVAHEINNPLEAIKNALYLVVSSTPPDDPNHRFLEIASKETERASLVIRQMLGFYRPRPTSGPTDVNQVLDELFALLEHQLRQHRISLYRQQDRALPPVLISPDQLKQVLLNLLLNAEQAMPNGGELHVSTRRSAEGDTEFLAKPSVLIQVRDTGVGIPDEHLRHIFEPFFSTKRDQRGTGLGLWVSLGIVQQHGGQIKVHSRPGRGTTFTVALPIGGQHE